MSTTSDIAQKATARPVFRPRVVVRLHDWVDVPYEDDVQRVLVEKFGPGPLGDLVDELRFERLYTAVGPEELDRLVAEAGARDPGYEARRLTRWFTVDTPRRLGVAELTKLLLAWDVVETAHPDAPAVDPLVNAANDPRAVNQGYLDPAPAGIDAEFAWTVPGGAGAGQRVVDLEQGWTLNHEDLAAHGANLLFGTLQNGSRPHGTAVLGELCAVDNTLGGIGIAPEVASVDVTSHSGSLSNVPDAVVAALQTMQPGDVLLLEVQTVTPAAPVFGAPIELVEESFEAIRLATALGIVVVEAAGNGANDLDTVVDSAGRRVLAPAHADFRDSGAIVVGAASSAVPHARLDFSSFGARVDCYAWGENVDTSSSTSAGATDLYTTGFSGTSSASPIIAGAALVVQGVAQAAGGGRLSPAQVRRILSDPATGTASAAPGTDRIGVMPDLRAIVEDVLDVGLEDVYLRDNTADTGAPHDGAISTSPDVILRPDVVADPQATYGEGSGTENSMTLGYEAAAGQDNHVYVRVRNRGAAPVGPTTVRVYWSEVGTLITPDQWHLVGSTTLPAVPVGDVLTVADPITWAAGDVPAPGHYCFVAVAETAQDPAPPLASLVDWDNFRAFIRNNNNVTWRNFNVVPTPGPDDPAVLPFHVAGALDRRLPMLVDVTARLPHGARLWLDGPDFLLEEAGLPVAQGEPVGDGLVRVPLRPQGRQTIARSVFPAKLRLGLRLVVALPADAREQTGYQVAVRQAVIADSPAGERQDEVGRVTWYLAGPDFYERRKAREAAGLA